MRRLSNARRSSLALVLAACLALPALAQQSAVGATDPDRLVQAAIGSNPLVGAARTEVDASRAEVGAARMQGWPSLSARSEANNTGFRSTLQLDQPIWTFGRVSHGIKRSKATLKAAESGISQSQYDIANRTITAWESFAAASIRQSMSEAQLADLAEFQGMIRRRVAQGVSANIDQDLADSRLLQVQVQKEAAESQRKLALARLEQLTGMAFDPETKISPEALKQLAEKYADIPDPNAGALAQAGEAHPSVVRARYLTLAANEAAAQRRASRWPSVYARLVHELGPGAIKANNGVGLGLSYTLGAASATYDTIAAAARAEGLAMQEEAARRLVVETVQTEWQNYLGARARTRSLEAALVGARSVKDSYARQFIAGKKSWLDVMNTVREVQQNELSISETLANTVASAYRLRLHMGQLPWQKGAALDE